MNNVVMAPLAVLAFACVTGAWFDSRWRRLPNWLSLSTLAAGLAYAALQGGISAMLLHLAHALAALVVGMVLFRLRVIGGGDAKFYAGVAGWFALSNALDLLLHTALAGLAAAIVWFIARRLAGKPVEWKAETPEGKFPFGIAIALGAITTFLALQS